LLSFTLVKEQHLLQRCRPEGGNVNEPAVFDIMFMQGYLGLAVTMVGVIIYMIVDACDSSMPAINAFVYTRALFDNATNFFLTLAVILGWGAFMALNFVLIGGTSGM